MPQPQVPAASKSKQMDDFDVIDDAFKQIDDQRFEVIGYPKLDYSEDLNVSIHDYRSYWA